MKIRKVLDITLYSHRATIPLIGSLSIEHYELSNGLQVAIVPDPTVPIFTYQTWFKVGSADEQAGRQGLAHLFEHMMFRKTRNREMGVWERQVNVNGGTGINAYTSRDQTVYYFSLPKEKLGLAADLEVDRMTNLVIESEMFETEKGAVLTERNRNLDHPGRYLWEELYKLVYPNHPYRYSIIGEENSIKGFTVQDATSFYQTYYSPNNALIIIVGDITPNEAISTIAHAYGHLPKSSITERPYVKEKPPASPVTYTLTHKRATQDMIAKAWLIENITHEDYPALSVAASLLAGQKTSILFKNLTNTGKARNVHADAFVGKDNGTFEFYAEVSEGEDIEHIEEIVIESINEVLLGQYDENQLHIVTNMIERELYANITSPSSMARFLGEGFIYANDFTYQLGLIDRMKQVTISDISNVIRKYLIDKSSVTVHLSPGT